MVESKGRRRIFYGWWLVLASTVAHAMYGGLYFYGFSTFFMPLIQEFGWSRTLLSGAFSLTRIQGGILGPLGGFLVDRLGARKMMAVGIFVMGAGFILLSLIHSLFAFYIVFIFVLALGGTTGMNQAAKTVIAHWFIRKRGTAFGIAVSGVGLGGAMVPVLGLLIVQYGWRMTCVYIGIAIWVIGIPLSLVMRTSPEKYGWLPDGDVKKDVRKEQPTDGKTLPDSAAVEDAEDISFTPRQALRTAAFWLLSLVYGLRQFVVAAVVVHQIPFLVGIGIAPELAATLLGSLALISIVGRLGFGRLSDYVQKRYVMAVCLAMLAVGCFILAGAQDLRHVILFLIIYSPAYGGGSIMMQALRADYFGRKHFATIMGWMDLFMMFGSVLGPIYAGWIFDISGSYRTAFVTFAIVATAAMVLMLAARRPVLRPAGVVPDSRTVA
ncbi:MAG: MFS transporter [Chloroflexota bacterium]